MCHRSRYVPALNNSKFKGRHRDNEYSNKRESVQSFHGIKPQKQAGCNQEDCIYTKAII